MLVLTRRPLQRVLMGESYEIEVWPEFTPAGDVCLKLQAPTGMAVIQEGGRWILDGEVSIRILSVRDREIRIGVAAPKHINIVREELLYRQHQYRSETDKTTKKDAA
ncbi:carbon storage regulator [Oceanospirillum sp.]|uniref:carbon storage regulator n=1 Tax=Oceanospirillum sp. TaxID=2021254 RepID=UPI003A8E1D61